ncbi:hypothetical protein NitYY0826_C1998 [Nitratiruptor sp. YY08-26]|uniref:vWA domain-containing protein n=1 Tax=unclassified Nitratiruptor TaxID=2624044 RepID=UPI001915D5FF|nr:MULTISPECIES: VWA domain-containing protein [unclassified Nitratiruptor]BCD63108.1 hypothetical protein NitYY0813_C1996 [Nitratiruptor sp. YY08-13]BCD67043.1 hypothetical protein NitYY0826_C1998 [Nitratiruptor sp. YY08-26]
MHFSFEYPFTFFLLFILFCFFRCKREYCKIYFAKTNFLPRTLLSKDYLPLIIAALFITALASPFTYLAFAKSGKKGRDLVLAIDASGSMGGDFGQRSKFDTLIDLARTFIQHRYDDNIGVVVFGTFAYPASPITYDTKALQFLLNYLELSIAGNNTAIGDAIMEAVKMLKKSDAKEKVIVLFTDGYHNSGSISPKQAVEEAKKIKAKIYTVGIGDEFDKKLLERIAKETEGESFSAKDEKALAAVMERIDELEKSPLRSGVYIDKHTLFPWMGTLLVGLLLLDIRRKI